MGLLSSLNPFSSDKKETTSSGTRDVSRTGTVEEQEKKTGTLNTEDVSTTTLLNPEVQKQLESLVLDLTGGQVTGQAGSDQLQAVALELIDRGRGAESDIKANNDAIIKNARRIGERQLDRFYTDLAVEAGGSTLNSFVAQAASEASATLETSLAAQQAELDIAARGVGTAEISRGAELLGTASGADATELNALAQLSNILRGATAQTVQTRAGETTELKDSSQQLSDIINEVTTGKNVTEDDRDLFDWAELFV